MIFDSNSSPVCLDHHVGSLLTILPAQGVYYTKPSMMPQTNASFEKDIKACQAKSAVAWMLFSWKRCQECQKDFICYNMPPETQELHQWHLTTRTLLEVPSNLHVCQARCQLQLGCLHFTYWPLTFGYDIMGPVLIGVNKSSENREDAHDLLTIRTYKKYQKMGWIWMDGALQVRLCSWQVFLFELPVTMKQSPATKSSQRTLHASHMRVPSLLYSLNHSSSPLCQVLLLWG